VLNAHGGNDLKPLVRDEMLTGGLLIVAINFWELKPELRDRIFEQPGDHADEMETSLLLHLRPELVAMDQAGRGERHPWKLKSLAQPGVWTPRPWSQTHPDTGSGDPRAATAQKGAEYLELIATAIAEIIAELSAARKGDLPYI
jgi:creatinine amidohydrolase